jgi:DNA-binding NtrC family response regulator
LQALTAAGYDVNAVRGYPEGRQALRAGRYDLLLTDLRLREFSGLQLVLMTPPAIPVIVLTGFPDPVIEREAHRLGATFVVKPIAPDRLLALIAERLAQLQAASSAPGYSNEERVRLSPWSSRVGSSGEEIHENRVHHCGLRESQCRRRVIRSKAMQEPTNTGPNP